jgi:endonuclease YncB( thermonuclease family)
MTRLSLLLLTGLMLPLPSWAATLRAVVVSVTNGNTITILGAAHLERKIRLAGIDAPAEGQGYAGLSKAHLTHLVLQKEVTVAWFREDRYGRIVGKVMIDGTDVGLRQIKAGLAWHRKGLQTEESLDDRTQYAAAEDTARSQHRGLWVDNTLLTTWDLRQKSR